MWATLLTVIKGVASAASALSTIDGLFGISKGYKEKKKRESSSNIDQAAANAKGKL